MRTRTKRAASATCAILSQALCHSGFLSNLSAAADASLHNVVAACASLQDRSIIDRNMAKTKIHHHIDVTVFYEQSAAIILACILAMVRSSMLFHVKDVTCSPINRLLILLRSRVA